MRRIICVGNRYVAEDSAGLAVYDRLCCLSLPAGVELINGGLAGLDLLRFVEGAERVVFVDGVSGFDGDAALLVLACEDVAIASTQYDHSAGLAYLLRILPEVSEGTPPEILLVGIRSHPDATVIDEAAALALKIARGSEP